MFKDFYKVYEEPFYKDYYKKFDQKYEFENPVSKNIFLNELLNNDV